MSKLVVIDNCEECPYHSMDFDGFVDFHRCDWEGMVIPYRFVEIFPEWCPIEDRAECG